MHAMLYCIAKKYCDGSNHLEVVIKAIEIIHVEVHNSAFDRSNQGALCVAS